VYAERALLAKFRGSITSPGGTADMASRSVPSDSVFQTARPAPTTAGPSPAENGRRVVGYYPIWMANAGYTSADIDFTALTHIAHFAIVPNADGTITVPDWGPFPDPALLARAHAAGVQAVLVAGTGDDPGVTASFAALASARATREAFVANLTALVNQYGYDGVDIDWEFPSNSPDRANCTQLLTTLRAALGTGRSLSISAPPTDWNGQWFDLAGLAPLLDWFAVMTYDLSGAGWSSFAEHNAPLYPGRVGEDSASTGVAYYESRGVPKHKILLGLPFFGQRFDAASRLFQPLAPPTPGSSPDYREIAPLIGNGWAAGRDAAAQVPVLVRDGAPGLISYDDAASIAAKCDYVKAQGLGGAIIWALGKDALNGTQPLLAAAKGCR